KLLTLLAASFAFATVAESEPAQITVNVRNVLGPANPRIFGHNMEAADTKGIFEKTTNINLIKSARGHWDPVEKIPVATVVEHAKAIGVTMMRYPGGCLAHNWDWRLAAGPLQDRGDWQFGLDEYIAFCRAID